MIRQAVILAAGKGTRLRAEGVEIREGALDGKKLELLYIDEPIASGALHSPRPR